MMNFKILNATRRKPAQAIHKRIRTVRRLLSFGWNVRSLVVYIGLLGSVFSSAAGAACELTQQWIAATATPITIHIPPIVVDSNTAVGDTIWSTSVPVPSAQPITNNSEDCYGTIMAAAGVDDSGKPSSADENNIYPTNVEGIGYRIKNSANQAFPFNVSNHQPSWNWPSSVQMEDLRFELIKTGPIQYGELLRGGLYGLAGIQTNNGTGLPVLAITVVPGGVVRRFPCALNKGDLTIYLGRVSTTQLESSNEMPFKEFSIHLNCDEDMDFKLQVIASSEDVEKGLIKADANSEAQGVVVQLTHDNDENTPVHIDKLYDKKEFGTFRQQADLKFKARLQKSSAEHFKLGNFVATATLWLSYE